MDTDTLKQWIKDNLCLDVIVAYNSADVVIGLYFKDDVSNHGFGKPNCFTTEHISIPNGR